MCQRWKKKTLKNLFFIPRGFNSKLIHVSNYSWILLFNTFTYVIFSFRLRYLPNKGFERSFVHRKKSFTQFIFNEWKLRNGLWNLRFLWANSLIRCVAAGTSDGKNYSSLKTRFPYFSEEFLEANGYVPFGIDYLTLIDRYSGQIYICAIGVWLLEYTYRRLLFAFRVIL